MEGGKAGIRVHWWDFQSLPPRCRQGPHPDRLLLGRHCTALGCRDQAAPQHVPPTAQPGCQAESIHPSAGQNPAWQCLGLEALLSWQEGSRTSWVS